MHVIHEIAPYKISHTAKIRDAARIIQQTKLRIVLVCDEQEKLVGTVTDGDIRRGVLNALDSKARITAVMNRTPKVVFHDSINIDQIYFQMRDLAIKHMPVVDAANRLVKIYFYDEFEEPFILDNPILLMAGGYGKRLRPLTNAVPKPMLEICGKPVIIRIIERLKRQGFWNFYISVNYLAHMIIDCLGDGSQFGVSIKYITEDQPLGTAGCLSRLDSVALPIIVMNGDILTEENFPRALTCFSESQVVASMGVKDYVHKVPFGCIQVKNNYIAHIEEKPDCRFLINAGVYILSPEVKHFVPKDSFFNMPDLFQLLIDRGNPVGYFHMHEDWVDIGQKEDLIRSQKFFEQKEVAID